MRTNIKNEIILLNQEITEMGIVRIGDIEISQRFTELNKISPIIAKTNENGMVEQIIIEVNDFYLGAENFDSTINIPSYNIVTGIYVGDNDEV